jgi:hypothetical protein
MLTEPPAHGEVMGREAKRDPILTTAVLRGRVVVVVHVDDGLSVLRSTNYASGAKPDGRH